MKGFLVGENSPSLWPTISSFISTSWYTLPLYTWNRSPTKLGRIVAERACVRIGGAFFPASGRMIGRLRWLARVFPPLGKARFHGGVPFGVAYGTMLGPGGGC